MAALGMGSAMAQSSLPEQAPQPAQDASSAQGETPSKTDTRAAKKLEAVTVTGSLIPQSQIETATPITTITSQDLKARGFSSVAEALQQSSFATGSVQGSQQSAGFTQGAQTLSMFGLPVGFVKYLIDGRPMGNFPALYNGASAFNNLSSIPVGMVDHIDILPGGQSSLYGSDAIAGVINIVLKKHLDAPTIDARYGWYSDGGGISRRINAADSFTFGKFNLLAGVQFESLEPIWGYDRDLTKQYFQNGTSAPLAGRDYVVLSGTKTTNNYLNADPNNCVNVSGQFNGTEGLRNRPNSGNYCGSFYSPGYKTITNGQKTANLYTHATYDATDQLQLYGDLLYNYQEQDVSPGSSYLFWDSRDFGYFFDPQLNDRVRLQRAFTPEDIGGYQSVMNKQYENSYQLTLGGKGTFGQSNWDYDLGFTHSDDQLVERKFSRFGSAIDDYFQNHVLGPQLGKTAAGVPIYRPNYDAFFRPMSPQDFRSFTGYIDNRSKTWDNLLRGQVTNASLFALHGGDAGIAAVLEGGNEGWDYVPDPRLLNGDIWGSTGVKGSGHRSRYAATTELRLPLLQQLTLDVSGRYDDYKVAGKHVNHGTYNLGLEYRPFDSLLLRAKYGTAFKAPTLADEFQGLSGYYSTVTDYYNCAKLGYAGIDLAKCPAKYHDVQYFGQQVGNPELKPITAKVWSYGAVWAPLTQLSLSVDYLHWDISNEVARESSDQLAQTEYQCRTGAFDINSPTCQMALQQITRDSLGNIVQIYTPKSNVSKEKVNALTANISYAQDIGRFGKLSLASSYSNVLKHSQQSYPGDPTIDLLRNPYYSVDFKTKLNGSITWSNEDWSATLYGNRYGSTPNYLASTVLNNYTSKGTGHLGAWILYNASVTYNPTPNLALSLLVNNLFNKMPPVDRSYPGTTTTPYQVQNYNVFGREIYIEAQYKFGKTR